MSGDDLTVWLSTARNPERALRDRIQALEQLARLGNRGLVPRLRELYQRPKTPTGIKTLDWDPEAAERVVDLYVILALYRSGDPSLSPQIIALVREAGKILQGPENELLNAAKVICATGSLRLIQELVALGDNREPGTVANAVRTLQMLDLPSPPTGGAVVGFPELVSPVTFTIHRLGEELETIAQLSKGRILLSPGVQETIRAHDQNRGEVTRRNSNLADILTMEIDVLGFTYAVTQRGVVICTFREAGARWGQEWPAYSKNLVWDPATQRWHL
jgi:hypothetical protein